VGNKTGRDLPAYVRQEINKMVLAIARGQLTQEQAMQYIARACLPDYPEEYIPPRPQLPPSKE
jgi:hypothetical protein